MARVGTIPLWIRDAAALAVVFVVLWIDWFASWWFDAKPSEIARADAVATAFTYLVVAAVVGLAACSTVPRGAMILTSVCSFGLAIVSGCAAVSSDWREHLGVVLAKAGLGLVVLGMTARYLITSRFITEVPHDE